MEDSELLKVVESHSVRINNLECKVNNCQKMHHMVERHHEKLILHDDKMQMIMKKLLELHTDLQNLASVRQHIMTAFAALGGAVAAYLIHFLPHL